MLWKESLSMQIKSLSNILQIDIDASIQNIENLMSQCKGIIYFTGVGKNYFTAARVSDTYTSLGIRAQFIDPVNTLHGSIGIFKEEDLVVALSKSGETNELVTFIEKLRSRNFVNTVLITSNYQSTLQKISKSVLVLPVEYEGDHLGIAPIASTMIYASILDSMAVELSSKQGFTRSDFIMNHPGGTIGGMDRK
jgi:arabinose-5-phosphate isomerase